MNINDQKEFLDSILNLSKHTKEKKDYDMSEVMLGLSDKLSNDSFNQAMQHFTNEDSTLNIDKVSEYCLSVGLDPIDLVEYVFDQVQQHQSGHPAGNIDLSKSNQIFQQVKKQFEEYKKSEDINNF